ncbi:MAG: MarR family transcriptional regulator [Methanosarcinales archaeon]
MPPSAKLVYKVLEFRGLLTQKDLIKETYLPARTVRSALERMKHEGLVEEIFCLEDARQCLYKLKSPDQFEEYLIANFACACPVLTKKSREC